MFASIALVSILSSVEALKINSAIGSYEDIVSPVIVPNSEEAIKKRESEKKSKADKKPIVAKKAAKSVNATKA